MKKILTVFILIHFLFLISCFRCGKDVHVGDYQLMAQSKEDWFPYLNVNSLSFKNSKGEVITLELKEQNSDTVSITYHTICDKGFFDNAVEYYNGEILGTTFELKEGNIRYSLIINLSVYHVLYPTDQTKPLLYDQVVYRSEIISNGNSFNGDIILIANSRGNSINTEDINTLAGFFETLQINGTDYSNVWHFARNGTPTLYVQQGRGILAFLGLDGEIWIVQ